MSGSLFNNRSLFHRRDALFIASFEGYCSERMLSHHSNLSLRDARLVLEDLRGMGCLDAFPVGKTVRYYITGTGRAYYDKLNIELDREVIIGRLSA